MSKLHVDTAMLSLSAPGAMIAGAKDAVRSLARKWNDYAFELRERQPAQFGFFAALPSLTDQAGAIAELKYALDALHADGVTLFTSYEGQYLGSKDFASIWAELDRRDAVIDVHPVHSREAPFTTPYLPQPLIDYPHETARTASDLVLSGRKRQFSRCKVILSHAGGTLPYLAERLSVLTNSLFSGLLDEESPSGDQIMDDVRSFYFDLALGGSANILDSLLKWAPQDHVLYGSDFPFASGGTDYFNQALEAYKMEPGLRNKYYKENAVKLFPRLRS